MKKSSIKLFITVMLLLSFPFGLLKASSIVPNDAPTLEAMIDLHKKIKADEEKAAERISTSYATQILIKDVSKKFNTARSTLDSKLNNAYSYLILGTSIASTATSLYQLIDDYADFTTNTIKYVKQKPGVAWYYTKANNAIAREIKHCQKLYAIFAASGTNLFRASMSDKMTLLMTLKSTIESCRNIIYSANLWCRTIVSGTWQPDYIWEILTSDVKDNIAKALISKWNQ